MPRQLGRHLGAGQPGGDHLGHHRRRQRGAGQLQRAGHAQVQVTRLARVRGEVGEQDQQRQAGQVRGERGQQLPGGAVDQVRVVDQQDHAVGATGQVAEERRAGREDVLVTGVRPGPGVEQAQIAEDLHDLGDAGGRGRLDDVPLRVRAGLGGQPVDPRHRRLDGLPQHRQRGRLVGTAGAGEHHAVVGGGQARGVLGEPGPAGSGRAVDHHDTTEPGPGPFPAAGQAVRLGVAPADRPAARGGLLRGRTAGAVPQRGEQAGRVGIAVVRVLGQEPVHHGRQRRIDLRKLFPYVGNRRGQVQAQQLADVLGLERQPSGQALEEHHAERVQIGSPVDRPSQHAGLLRRGVQERADGLVGVLVGVPAELGQPEVDQLGPAVLVDHDVVRLDVPVDQPDPVRGGEPASQLRGQPDHPLLGQHAVDQQVGEGATGEVLQHQAGHAVHLADRVHPDHARVVDAGQQGGLTLERGTDLGQLAGVRERALQRIVAVAVPYVVHHGERTAPELLDHVEAGQFSGVRAAGVHLGGFRHRKHSFRRRMHSC